VVDRGVLEPAWSQASRLTGPYTPAKVLAAMKTTGAKAWLCRRSGDRRPSGHGRGAPVGCSPGTLPISAGQAASVYPQSLDVQDCGLSRRRGRLTQMTRDRSKPTWGTWCCPDPLELIEKLCVLVPPPPGPTCCAITAAWRALIVPARAQTATRRQRGCRGVCGAGAPGAKRADAPVWTALPRRVFAFNVLPRPDGRNQVTRLKACQLAPTRRLVARVAARDPWSDGLRRGDPYGGRSSRLRWRRRAQARSSRGLAAWVGLACHRAHGTVHRQARRPDRGHAVLF
jgi:hypothetical protein